jgi:hypothetical protein
MTLAFLYWLFMILWFVFGLWQGWGPINTPNAPNVQYVLGGHFLLFILFLLLGLHAFGWPIKT